jgi:hypothetical protein
MDRIRIHIGIRRKHVQGTMTGSGYVIGNVESGSVDSGILLKCLQMANNNHVIYHGSLFFLQRLCVVYECAL